MTLPFTLKSILMQKKNYGSSNIFNDARKHNLQKKKKKNPLKETQKLQDIIPC
jgi:hypothetical protein